MNVLKYLFSKPYRTKRKSEYTKNLCSKFAYEETCEQEIYEAILSTSKK